MTRSSGVRCERARRTARPGDRPQLEINGSGHSASAAFISDREGVWETQVSETLPGDVGPEIGMPHLQIALTVNTWFSFDTRSSSVISRIARGRIRLAYLWH